MNETPQTTPNCETDLELSPAATFNPDTLPCRKWCVEILTPGGRDLHPEAAWVELATVDGQIGVMPGHERLFTALDVGELVIHNGKQRETYLVGGGFARIQPWRLSVLAFSLDRATDGGAWERCRARRREILGGGEEDSDSEASAP